jgi:oligosaccharyltransferase complex subunit beta
MNFDENSKLLIPILRGSKTSYSYKQSAITDTPHTLGKKTILVAGLQCRNSARITFVGSLEMLSNKYYFFNYSFYSKNSFDNKIFGEELTKWNFKERGILRHRDIKHHKVNSTEMQSIYRIKDEIVFFLINLVLFCYF